MKLLLSTLIILLFSLGEAFTFLSPGKTGVISDKLRLQVLPDTLGLPSEAPAAVEAAVEKVVESTITTEATEEAVNTVVQQVDVAGQAFPDILPVAIGLVALGGATAFVLRKDDEGKEDESVAAVPPEEDEAEVESINPPTKEPAVDLSIPYDAAAALAYKHETGKDGAVNDPAYAAFKEEYEKSAVASVIAKKKAREEAE